MISKVDKTQQTDLFHRRNINLYQWQMFNFRSYSFSIQLDQMAEWFRWQTMKQDIACSIPIGSHFFFAFYLNCLIFYFIFYAFLRVFRNQNHLTHLAMTALDRSTTVNMQKSCKKGKNLVVIQFMKDLLHKEKF